MLNKLHKSLFFLLVLLLPINLAKHFIFGWSYVNGMLIDYLIPSIYLTDTVFICLIAVWDIDLIITRPKYKFLTNVWPLFLVLFLFLVSLSFNVNSYPSLYKMIKYYEMLFIFLYTALNFSFKFDFDKFTLLLSFSVLFQSTLGFIQWVRRGSLFNNYLFFGEQPYNFKTPGVNFENFFGVSVIPPYGTFPHPNILAGFLSISLVVLLFYILTRKTTTIHVCAFFYGLLVLFLTLSLASWISLGFGIILILLHKLLGKKVFVFGLSLILLTNLAIVSLAGRDSFSFLSSVYRRTDLTKVSIRMVLDKPLFGVGLNTFTVNLNNYGGVRGVVKFVQPVHNIYLLVASESGVASLALFLLFIFLLIKRVHGANQGIFLPEVLLTQLLLLGTFDHYLLTLQQGMLLFWLTLGLLFSTIVVHEG